MKFTIWQDERGWCWGERYPNRISEFFATEDTARRTLLAAYPDAIITTLHLKLEE